MTIKTYFAALAFSLVAAAAQAAVIDFSNLTNSNGTAYTGHSQVGFDVDATTAGWLEAHVYGSPLPSIYNRSDTGIIDVTRTGGGTFHFNSSDLGNANSGQTTSVSYVIEGFLGASSLFSQMGTVMSTPGFETIGTSFTGLIDRLVISMDGTNTSSYNIDNINVNIAAVPLPAGGLLMFTALGGLVLSRRRKKAA